MGLATADFPIVPDGDDSFVAGMNSYTPPWKLNPGEFVEAMNIINRGGIAQTRPGSVALFDMPPGNVQGSTFFTPTSGIPQLVFAVDGSVYASAYPFRVYSKIPNIQFSPYSKYVAWAPCLKSTDFLDDGTLVVMDVPISVLIMQDGNTRAAYWDGTVSRHLNPTISGGTFTKPGFDETPIGLWMAWSNNRLWLSRDGQIFASDIGNPLKFTETQYLSEGRAFYLTGPCTGVVETSDRQGVVCFTKNNGVFLQTSIQDRTTWLSTPGFQQTILPTVGCVAPRSIVTQYGLTWWYSQKGLLNQNDALRLNLSSRIDIQDNQMSSSKANLSYDLSGVCGGYTENFLFHAVPNGDSLNTRVHVLDQAPLVANNTPYSYSAPSWAGYWTGWRPVEFARGVVNSHERVFCCSVDYDGINRMWELFRPEKTDNGIPITSFVASRLHLFGNRDYKKFRYAEIELHNISGPTAVMVAARGIRGAYQPIMAKDINAVNGQIYSDQKYGLSNRINGSRLQTRIVRTQDGASASDCNSVCIESDILGLNDKGFSILVVWSGIAGVGAYRIFSQGDPQAYQGICEDDETSENLLLSPAGCGVIGRFTTSTPWPRYVATASQTRSDPVGNVVSKTFTQASIINQQDANRKAARTVEWFVQKGIGELL